jgi:hypothetical protein
MGSMLAVLHGVAGTETLVACSIGVFPISKGIVNYLVWNLAQISSCRMVITKKKAHSVRFLGGGTR